MQSPDQENSQTKWHGKMCWDVLVIRKQDWRSARFSSECVVQWWSPLLSFNTKNSVLWGAQAPNYSLQRQLHSAKSTAWVAISKHGITGPFRFECDVRQTVTVNKERYIVDALYPSWCSSSRAMAPTRRCNSPHSPELNTPDFYLCGFL